MTGKSVVPTTKKRASKMAPNQSVNLNHLLNFTLPPRQTHMTQSLPRRSRKTGMHQGVWNKERFVNAQYRFVMNPTGDYTVHFADPDIFFQWHDILQVIIPRSSVLASAAATGERTGKEEGDTTCPICLSPPSAPRMTKCGHVFCFPCILHYLNTSDNKWARCPICFDSINEKQLKSVKWFDRPVRSNDDLEESHAESSSGPTCTTTPRDGSTMCMRLMQRPQITTLALPRSHTWPSDLIPPHQAPFHFLPDVYNYAKFMLATPAYLIADLMRDLDELTEERRILAGVSDDLEISFVDEAGQKVKDQIAKAAALETTHLKDAVDKVIRDQHGIQQRHRKEEEGAHEPIDIAEDFLATKSVGYVTLRQSAPDSAPTSNRNVPRQRRNLNPPPPSTSTYYYYQAASGLPIFLHPLDIKIMFSHFNGYASFPDVITISIESFTEGSVNDDLRKRCKYLGHMPEGADVVFVEADLVGVVGVDGTKNFEGALKTRRARRKEKERKDDRARARAEERERGREEVRVSIPWNETSHSVVASEVLEAPDIPVEELHPLPERTEGVGAWGARSFASALHSTPTQRPAVAQRPMRAEVEDEWDVDFAWHELEQRSGAGRNKRSNKLLVLGGGGGGRRR